MNYKLIGTNHISKQSKEDIKKEFSDYKPDIIAVELDLNRYKTLKSKQNQKISITSIKTIGITGYLFALIGRIVQKKLGKIMNVEPGEEMLLATNLAKKNKLKLYLIDQDIRITLKNLSKKVSFKEKMKMLKDLIISPFSKNKIKIDLSKVPEKEILENLMEEFKQKYPGTYKALLEDRNKYMAKQIIKINQLNPEQKIMIVIGAGHQKGIEEILQNARA
ncbi:MAG: TraB/GumN family protein [Candidatus Woesearchaeota archaeon]